MELILEPCDSLEKQPSSSTALEEQVSSETSTWFGGTLQSILLRAGSNVSLKLSNVLIKVIQPDEGFATALTFQTLHLENSLPGAWQNDLANPEAWLRKQMEITMLSILIEKVKGSNFPPLLRTIKVDVSVLLPAFAYLEGADLDGDDFKASVELSISRIDCSVNDRQVAWLEHLVLMVARNRDTAGVAAGLESDFTKKKDHASSVQHKDILAVAEAASSTENRTRLLALGVFNKVWDFVVDEASYIEDVDEESAAEERRLRPGVPLKAKSFFTCQGVSLRLGRVIDETQDFQHREEPGDVVVPLMREKKECDDVVSDIMSRLQNVKSMEEAVLLQKELELALAAEGVDSTSPKQSQKPTPTHTIMECKVLPFAQLSIGNVVGSVASVDDTLQSLDLQIANMIVHRILAESMLCDMVFHLAPLEESMGTALHARWQLTPSKDDDDERDPVIRASLQIGQIYGVFAPHFVPQVLSFFQPIIALSSTLKPKTGTSEVVADGGSSSLVDTALSSGSVLCEASLGVCQIVALTTDTLDACAAVLMMYSITCRTGALNWNSTWSRSYRDELLAPIDGFQGHGLKSEIGQVTLSTMDHWKPREELLLTPHEVAYLSTPIALKAAVVYDSHKLSALQGCWSVSHTDLNISGHQLGILFAAYSSLQAQVSPCRHVAVAHAGGSVGDHWLRSLSLTIEGGLKGAYCSLGDVVQFTCVDPTIKYNINQSAITMVMYVGDVTSTIQSTENVQLRAIITAPRAVRSLMEWKVLWPHTDLRLLLKASPSHEADVEDALLIISQVAYTSSGKELLIGSISVACMGMQWNLLLTLLNAVCHTKMTPSVNRIIPVISVEPMEEEKLATEQFKCHLKTGVVKVGHPECRSISCWLTNLVYCSTSQGKTVLSLDSFHLSSSDGDAECVMMMSWPKTDGKKACVLEMSSSAGARRVDGLFGSASLQCSKESFSALSAVVDSLHSACTREETALPLTDGQLIPPAALPQPLHGRVVADRVSVSFISEDCTICMATDMIIAVIQQNRHAVNRPWLVHDQRLLTSIDMSLLAMELEHRKSIAEYVWILPPSDLKLEVQKHPDGYNKMYFESTQLDLNIYIPALQDMMCVLSGIFSREHSRDEGAYFEDHEEIPLHDDLRGLAFECAGEEGAATQLQPLHIHAMSAEPKGLFAWASPSKARSKEKEVELDHSLRWKYPCSQAISRLLLKEVGVVNIPRFLLSYYDGALNDWEEVPLTVIPSEGGGVVLSATCLATAEDWHLSWTSFLPSWSAMEVLKHIFINPDSHRPHSTYGLKTDVCRCCVLAPTDIQGVHEAVFTIDAMPLALSYHSWRNARAVDCHAVLGLICMEGKALHGVPLLEPCDMSFTYEYSIEDNFNHNGLEGSSLELRTVPTLQGASVNFKVDEAKVNISELVYHDVKRAVHALLPGEEHKITAPILLTNHCSGVQVMVMQDGVLNKIVTVNGDGNPIQFWWPGIPGATSTRRGRLKLKTTSMETPWSLPIEIMRDGLHMLVPIGSAHTSLALSVTKNQADAFCVEFRPGFCIHNNLASDVLCHMSEELLSLVVDESESFVGSDVIMVAPDQFSDVQLLSKEKAELRVWLGQGEGWSVPLKLFEADKAPIVLHADLPLSTLPPSPTLFQERVDARIIGIILGQTSMNDKGQLQLDLWPAAQLKNSLPHPLWVRLPSMEKEWVCRMVTPDAAIPLTVRQEGGACAHLALSSSEFTEDYITVMAPELSQKHGIVSSGSSSIPSLPVINPVDTAPPGKASIMQFKSADILLATEEGESPAGSGMLRLKVMAPFTCRNELDSLDIRVVVPGMPAAICVAHSSVCSSDWSDLGSCPEHAHLEIDVLPHHGDGPAVKLESTSLINLQTSSHTHIVMRSAKGSLNHETKGASGFFKSFSTKQSSSALPLGNGAPISLHLAVSVNVDKQHGAVAMIITPGCALSNVSDAPMSLFVEGGTLLSGEGEKMGGMVVDRNQTLPLLLLWGGNDEEDTTLSKEQASKHHRHGTSWSGSARALTFLAETQSASNAPSVKEKTARGIRLSVVPHTPTTTTTTTTTTTCTKGEGAGEERTPSWSSIINPTIVRTHRERLYIKDPESGQPTLFTYRVIYSRGIYHLVVFKDKQPPFVIKNETQKPIQMGYFQPCSVSGPSSGNNNDTTLESSASSLVATIYVNAGCELECDFESPLQNRVENRKDAGYTFEQHSDMGGADFMTASINEDLVNDPEDEDAFLDSLFSEELTKGDVYPKNSGHNTPTTIKFAAPDGGTAWSNSCVLVPGIRSFTDMIVEIEKCCATTKIFVKPAEAGVGSSLAMLQTKPLRVKAFIGQAQLCYWVDERGVVSAQDGDAVVLGQELFSVTVDGLELSMEKKFILQECHVAYSILLGLKKFQCDTYLLDSDYPVVLSTLTQERPTLVRETKKSIERPVEFYLQLRQYTEMQQAMSFRNTWVDDCTLRVPPIAASVDDALLLFLEQYRRKDTTMSIPAGSSSSSSNSSNATKEKVKESGEEDTYIQTLCQQLKQEAQAAAGSRLFIGSARIEEISLLLDVHVSMGTAGVPVAIDTNRSPLTLSKIAVKNALFRPDVILRGLAAHGMAEALLNAPGMLGSLQLLFNPTGLVRSVRQGMSDLVNLPLAALQAGSPADFIAGLGYGTTSLLKHISGWTLTSISGFSFAFSRAVDNAVARRGDEGKQGGTLAEQSSGMLSDLGRGLIGAVSLPVTGALGLLGSAAAGLASSTGMVEMTEPGRQGRELTISRRARNDQVPILSALLLYDTLLRVDPEYPVSSAVLVVHAQSAIVHQGVSLEATTARHVLGPPPVLLISKLSMVFFSSGGLEPALEVLINEDLAWSAQAGSGEVTLHTLSGARPANGERNVCSAAVVKLIVEKDAWQRLVPALHRIIGKSTHPK